MRMECRELKQNILNGVKTKLSRRTKLDPFIIYEDGDFPQNKVYINQKLKAFEEVGIKVITKQLSDMKIRDKNDDVNKFPSIVQLPIVNSNSTILQEYLMCINPILDADMLGYECKRNMWFGFEIKKKHYPATTKAVLTILEYFNIPIEGQDILLIGRSDLVNKPLIPALVQMNATVTIAHSKTKNLIDKINRADIVVSAVGKENLVNENNCTRLNDPNFTFIDVAIDRNEKGELHGDLQKGNWNCNYTPVPGGVGQITVAELVDRVSRMI